MLTSVRILQLYAQHAVIPDRDAAGIALINVARAVEREARQQALEEAAKVCERVGEPRADHIKWTADRCAAAGAQRR